MEMRTNYCKKPGLPKTHSKKAVPLNRQLQALNGTYKSHETKEHEKKIKIGQKKLLERMKSDDSEFSIASTDDVASSKVEKCELNPLKTCLTVTSAKISAEIRTQSLGRICPARKPVRQDTK